MQSLTPKIVTVGTFDGVHKGHRKLILELISAAGVMGMESMVVLFSIPPRNFLSPGTIPGLITLDVERKEILEGLGVDCVRFLAFDRHLAESSRTRFFEDYLLKRYMAGGIVVGEDFAFGKDRTGDAGFLERACRKKGLFFKALPVVGRPDGKVSSTHVRHILKEGRVREAAGFLGRPYFVTGKVVGNKGLGKKLGFPTINLDVNPLKLLPAGVFRVRAVLGSTQEVYMGAANVGTRPSVDGIGRGCKPVLEVHLLGFSGNLAGRQVRIEFVEKIRDEKKFSSLEELKKRIARDVLIVRGRNGP